MRGTISKKKLCRIGKSNILPLRCPSFLILQNLQLQYNKYLFIQIIIKLDILFANWYQTVGIRRIMIEFDRVNWIFASVTCNYNLITCIWIQINDKYFRERFTFHKETVFLQIRFSFLAFNPNFNFIISKWRNLPYYNLSFVYFIVKK